MTDIDTILAACTDSLVINANDSDAISRSPEGEEMVELTDTDRFRTELATFKTELRARMVAELQGRLLGQSVLFRDRVLYRALAGQSQSARNFLAERWNDDVISRGEVIAVKWEFDYDCELSWIATVRRLDGTTASCCDYDLLRLI